MDPVDQVENLLRIISDRRDRTVISRVTEQHIDRTKTFDALLYIAFDVGALGDVCQHGEHASTIEPYGRSHKSVRIAVDKYESSTLVSESPRRCESDTARSACNNAMLTLETSHLVL